MKVGGETRRLVKKNDIIETQLKITRRSYLILAPGAAGSQPAGDPDHPDGGGSSCA
jgi:hypothetical protein